MTLRIGVDLRRLARGWVGAVVFALCVAAGISPPFPVHADVQLSGFGVSTSGGVAPSTAAPQSVAPILAATPSRDSVSDAVGATLATFRVDEAGNSSYSIPIQISPGVAGVAPKLALSYNSRMPSSVVGPGWSISGVSQITRCRQTRESGDFMSGTTPVDGNPPPVNFTPTDRFCLDGARLLLLSGNTGAYGADGTTYSPETDPTTLVTAHVSVAAAGPTTFTVQRKDGTTSTYGNTMASTSATMTATLPATGSSVNIGWNLARAQDSSGNYIDYLYTNDPSGSTFPFGSAAVESVLHQVNYTGHATSPVSSPFAGITFNYATQPIGQVRLGYQAGVAFLQSQQLASVSVTNSGTTMRYYDLEYQTSVSGSGLQQLKQVQECRDSSRAVCFPATSFAWSKANYTQVADTNQSGPSFSNLAGYKIADVDGDGRMDVAYAVNNDSNCSSGVSAIYVGFLDQTASHQMTLTTLGQKPVCATINLQSNDQAWYLLDYDGDGKADLLIGGAVGSSWAIYPGVGRPGSGSKAFNTSTNLLSGISIPVPSGLTAAAGLLLDLNGDGLPDFIYPVAAGSTSGVADVNARLLIRQANGSLGFSDAYTINFNYAAGDTNCRKVGVAINCDFNFFNNTYSPLQSAVISSDINADGRGDLTVKVLAQTDTGGSQIVQNDGQLHFNPAIDACESSYSPDLVTNKFLWYQFTVSNITPPAGSTTGSITFAEFWNAPTVSSGGGLPNSPSSMFVVDLNNDGLADVLYQDTMTTTKYWALINTGNGYQSAVAITGLPSDPTTLQFADINGDGRTDLVFSSGSSYKYVTLTPSTSTAWVPSTAQSAPAGLKYTSGWVSLIGDFDGDGIPDQLSFAGSGGSNLYTSRVAGNTATATCTSTTDSAACSRYHAHDAITGFTDGYGATTTIAYQPLTNEGVYQRGGEDTLNTGKPALQAETDWGWYSPVFDVIAPMYVVSMVKSSAPTKGNPNNVSAVYYAYTGALMQGGGRGFLGFFENLSFDANDAANEGNQYMVSLNAYAQRYPFTGIPEDSFKSAFTGSLTRGTAKLDTCATNIEDSSNCFLPAGSYPWPWPYDTGVIVSNSGALPACNGAGCEAVSVNDCTSTDTSMARPLDLGAGAFTPPAVAQPVFPYAHITVDSQADLAGTAGLAGVLVTSGTTGYFCYDTNSPSRGNLLYSRTITTDGGGTAVAQKLTANTFTDDTTHWFLGRLTHSDITFVRPGVSNIVRTSDFTYDTATGLLTSEEVEKGQSANLDLLTVYTLDAYGNRTGAYHCSNGFTAADCKSTAGLTQQQSGSTIHRYAKTAFDDIGRYSTGSALPFYSPGGTGNLNEQTAITISGRDEFGNATSQSSINGLTQSSLFGALGRPYFAADNTGKAATTTFRLCGIGANKVGCSSDAMLKFRSQTVMVGGPTTWTYFDVLGRPVVKIAQAFDNNPAGQKFTAVCTYEDGHNRPMYQSEPFFLDVAANESDGGAPTLPSTAAPPCTSAGYATTNQYDVLGRSTLLTNSDGGTIGSSYVGLNVFVTNPRNYTFETDKNALGEVIETRDPDVPGDVSGLIVDTGYDAAGDVVSITRDALHNGNPSSSTKIISSFTPDVLGRKTMQSDPDSGTSHFTYNAAGDVLTLKDAKNQTITNSYDALGRRWKRTTTTGSDGNAIIDTWTFDATSGICSTSHSCGQLASESRTSTSGATFSRTQTYDSYGRASTRNTSIAGNAYSEVSAYDAYGRPMSQQDASGNTLTTNYTTEGYLSDLTDSRVGALYQVNAMTARGQVSQDERGNVAALNSTATYNDQTGRIESICSGTSCGLQQLSYQFDQVGNLTQRERATNTAPTIETFTNDALNRLKLAQLTYVQGVHQGTPVTTASLAYDLLGNVCTKNGVAYHYAGYAGCTNHGSSSSPQAVTQVGSVTYQYDADGNQTTSNNGRTLVYNALNQLAKASAGTAQTAFQYTPDGTRFLRTDSGSAVPPTDCPTDNTPNDRIFCNGFETTSGGGTQTTYYVGNVEVIKNGTSTETRRYLAGLAIDYVRSSGADETRYTFADHLGSVDVIASSTGALIEMASFDAHGSRRDPYTWQGTASPLVSTTHGFTGQEHVDAMEFIHFNGRIYDPALGRMLQADPLTGPGNQSLNRYSYVVNNPLSLTDPSGYSWMHNLDRAAGWITFGPLFPSVRNDYYAALANPYVRTAGAIVAAYFTFGGASALLADAGWSSAAAAAGASAAAGFASGAIQSGTFEGGLYGAFSAELFFGIGSAFNGASWAHAGGTIGPTDLNAVGFTAKVLAHGIAGGALSSLQGGKFGDGFIGAGVSEALSPAVSSLHNEAGRVTVAALIGGTASKLSGGKFTNGAYSAAFGQLFNDGAHKLTKSQALAAYKAGKAYIDRINGMSDAAMLQIPGVADFDPSSSATSVVLAKGFVEMTLGGDTLSDLGQFLAQNEADAMDDVIANIFIGVPASQYSEMTKLGWEFYDNLSRGTDVYKGFRPGQASAGCNFVQLTCGIIIGK